MEIDYSPRQSGKTTRMLEWLRADENRVLLVHNYESAHDLGHLNRDVSDRIMSWNDYVRKQDGKRNPLERVAIDNAEFFFRSIIRAPIDKISMSTPETINKAKTEKKDLESAMFMVLSMMDDSIEHIEEGNTGIATETLKRAIKYGTSKI